MDNLKTQLKALSIIGPDEHFVAAARRGILAVRNNNRRPAWGVLSMWATAFAMLVISIVTATSFVRSDRTLTAVESPEILSQEFNNLTINVELKAITYRQTVDQTIASALTEISSNTTRHLNRDLLESEQKYFDVPTGEGNNPQIDSLLNKVIF